MPVRIAHEGRGRHLRRIDRCMRTPLAHAREGIAAGGDDDITTDHQVGHAGAHAGGLDMRRVLGHAYVRHHRAALLGQAAHVQHRTGPAFDVRRHGDDLADGNHARAAHAGDHDAVGLRQPWQQRLRQRWQGRPRLRLGAYGLLQLATFHRHEAGAETVHAGIILVAGRLVDLALAAELGFQRLDRQAIGLHAAIATAFAHRLVDDGALGRVGIGIAFAAATLFRGAGLVIDHGRHTRLFTQFALHGIEFAAMADGHAFGPLGAGRILVRLVGDHDDGPHVLSGQLARDHGRIERAVELLATGHGDRIVVQDLVRDIDLRRDRGAHRQQAGMEVGAITEVGEDVLFRRERRLSDPGHALAAHVGEEAGLAVHPGDHVMATDTGQATAAIGQFGGGIVRTARAEMRHAVLVRIGLAADVEGRFLGFEIGHARAYALLHRMAGEIARDARGNRACDLRRVQFIGGRQQPVAMAFAL